MPRPDARVGTELGSYRIEALLGRGGMGVVYRAEHLRLRRKVALKLLAPELADEEDFRARFLRESQLAASIDHPNIIPIYEAGEAEGEFFLAMRYVDGTDLASRLKAGPLEPAEAVAILAQVASALDAAHAAGLVHRDVKPGNILLAPGRGADAVPHVYLTDFGLTKRKDSRSGLTRTGTFIGSLEYIAPEQIEGREVDGSADLYALGAVAFHCLTGHPPFERDTEMALLYAHVNAPAPSATAGQAQLPPAVDAVLARAMAKKPEQRYSSGDAFIRALRLALGLRPTEIRPIPAVALGSRERWPLLAASAVGVLLVGAVGLSFALRGAAPTSSEPPSSAAVAQPTPTPMPSPISTAFPNGAEQALLARLPPAVARHCRRDRPYLPPRAHAGEPVPGVLASVRCDLGGASGARIAWFETLASTFGSDPQPTKVARLILFKAAGLQGISSGDCATEVTGLADWGLGSEKVGALACYQEQTVPRSWLLWSYDTTNVLARAMREDLDDRALYRWWQSVAPFVRTD